MSLFSGRAEWGRKVPQTARGASRWYAMRLMWQRPSSHPYRVQACASRGLRRVRAFRCLSTQLLQVRKERADAWQSVRIVMVEMPQVALAVSTAPELPRKGRDVPR